MIGGNPAFDDAPDDTHGDSARTVLSVTELTRRIKSILERGVGAVWLEGELSNVRCPASGHFYFTIKDATAQITGVLFRGSQRGMACVPKDGLLVRVFGEVTVYERGGNYQIIVRRIEPAGKGSLQAKFEALRKKLQEEGLFEAARKRRLPLLPRHLGIVTSRTGAAIRDILNILGRRFPNLHIIVAPCRVQGDGAAEEIAAAIDLLNAYGGLDAMIVGRGGGSVEDLWCFNEEIVARAVARSRIPVISAVGHETDFTICDFVADLRAPTPSAAAELVVGQKESFEEGLSATAAQLTRSLRRATLEARNRLLSVARGLAAREPLAMLQRVRQRMDAARFRVTRSIEGAVGENQQRVDSSAQQLQHALAWRRQAEAERLSRMRSQLRALNPLAVLTRGYSITSDEHGRILRSARDVRGGQRLSTRLSDGTIESTATQGG